MGFSDPVDGLHLEGVKTREELGHDVVGRGVDSLLEDLWGFLDDDRLFMVMVDFGRALYDLLVMVVVHLERLRTRWRVLDDVPPLHESLWWRPLDEDRRGSLDLDRHVPSVDSVIDRMRRLYHVVRNSLR